VAVLTGVGGLCDIISRKEYCSAKKVFQHLATGS